MGLQPLNVILIGLVSLSAAGVMAYWWIVTKGRWWDWPAGRSLMALLAIISVITGNAVIHSVFPIGPASKTITYALLYVLMLSCMGLIGCTIRTEMRKGQRMNRRATDTEKDKAHD